MNKYYGVSRVYRTDWDAPLVAEDVVEAETRPQSGLLIGDKICIVEYFDTQEEAAYCARFARENPSKLWIPYMERSKHE